MCFRHEFGGSLIMFRKLFRLLVVLLAFAAAPTLHAQEGISKEKQEKIQAKKEKKDTKEVKKEEKRIAKKHLKNQKPEVRKRMKQHKKRAGKQGNTGHRDPFFRRLFGSKH
jgi:Flp pilus assembly protein TadB